MHMHAVRCGALLHLHVKWNRKVIGTVWELGCAGEDLSAFVAGHWCMPHVTSCVNSDVSCCALQHP